MKVLLIAHCAATGGTRSYLKWLLRTHKKNNIETQVILSADADEDIKSFISNEGASYLLVRPRKDGRDYKPYFSLVYEFITYTKIFRSFSPDLVVVSSGTPALEFSWFFYPVSLVHILHTYPWQGTWKTWAHSRIPRFLGGEKKRICAVSQHVAKNVVEQWGAKPASVDCVYNSFNPLNVSVAPVKPAKKIVLTIGHVVEYKNPVIWLQVAREVTQSNPDVQFIWLGDGPLLKDFILATSSEADINFLGHVNDVAKYYGEAALYFHPSCIEALGLSVIDAMANNLPCVVSDAGGLPECIIDGESGFVCSVSDAESYSQRILELVENEQQCMGFGTKARMRAEQYFDPIVHESNLLAVYQKSLSV